MRTAVGRSARGLRAWAVTLGCVTAFVRAGGASAPSVPRTSVASETLSNGLRVLVLSQPDAPEVELAVAFRAGSAYEPMSQGGLAHLVEHMSFHGAEELGSRDWRLEQPILDDISRAANEFSRESARAAQADFERLAQIVERLAKLDARARRLGIDRAVTVAHRQCGARRHTASTGRDFVVFQTTLTAKGLACSARVEAQRMRGSRLRAFMQERQAIIEELRVRGEQHAADVSERAVAAALGAHPYGRSNWGTREEISRLTPDRADAFFRRFYRPANAVVIVVGNVAAATAFAAIADAFSGVPGGVSAPPLPEVPLLGPARVARTDAVPELGVAWRWPSRRSADIPPLLILAEAWQIRLRRALVDRPVPAASAIDLRTFAAGGAAGAVSLLIVRARDRGTVPVIEDEIGATCDAFRRRPLSEAEMTGARDRVLDIARGVLNRPRDLAREVAVAELQSGRGELVLELPATIRRVTVADVNRVARLRLDPRELCLIAFSPAGDMP